MTMTKEKKKKKWDDMMSRYKTYDTSTGRGGADAWKASFEKRMGKNPEVDSIPATAAFEHILELHECQTKADLKDVYKKLMKQFHPDVAGDTEENNQISQEINSEYKKLLRKLK